MEELTKPTCFRSSRQSAAPLGKQLDTAGGGSQIAGQGAEEGGLAGAVGAQNDPVLARGDFPGNLVKNQRAAALHGEVGDGKAKVVAWFQWFHNLTIAKCGLGRKESTTKPSLTQSGKPDYSSRGRLCQR